MIFGAAGGFAPSLSLAALDGTNGFRLDGSDNYDSSGISVSSAGDVNGDGFDDVIIGAPGSQFTPISGCLLYTSPSPRDRQKSRMPSSA